MKNPAAVALGRLGGQQTSEAKAAAARANGAQEGSPKTKKRVALVPALDPHNIAAWTWLRKVS